METEMTRFKMPKIETADKWSDKDTWPPSRFGKRVAKYLSGRKIKTVLDLGCGNGRDAQYFAKRGYAVIALDIELSGSLKEKLTQQGIKCVQQDLRRLKLKPNSFDAIFAHLSLHYFDDKTLVKIIDKIYHGLKPGGYFFIKCKSIADPLFGKGKKLEENYYGSDLKRHFFSSEYMEEKLVKFKIIKIQKTRSFTRPAKAAFIEAIAVKK